VRGKLGDIKKTHTWNRGTKQIRRRQKNMIEKIAVQEKDPKVSAT